MKALKTFNFPFFLFFSFFLIGIVYAEGKTVFNLSHHTVYLEVWPGFNEDAEGNVTVADDKFLLWVNDTSGGWGLAKVCRGIMPHDWGIRYARLDYEPTFQKSNIDPTLTINISLKLVDYLNYTADNSTVNVSFVLFCDGHKENYFDKCYQTEIQLFSFVRDGVKTNEEWFFNSPFNDSVAQFKYYDPLVLNETKTYSLTLNPYIYKMMQHYNLDAVTVKHVEIFTEAYKGYGKFELYNAIITAESPPLPTQLLYAFIPLILFVACVMVLKGMIG